MNGKNEEDLEAFIDDSRKNIGAAHGDLTKSFGTRLVMWCIRWSLGFGIIWLVTSWTESMPWLWTVGFVLSGISLAVLVGMYVLVTWKTKRTQNKLDDLQNIDFDD